LCALIESSGGFAYARARARQLADEARGTLAAEPRNAARKALDIAVDYAIQRDH
jgi:geranylgeranyl pyrophosphate synthase